MPWALRPSPLYQLHDIAPRLSKIPSKSLLHKYLEFIAAKACPRHATAFIACRSSTPTQSSAQQRGLRTTVPVRTSPCLSASSCTVISRFSRCLRPAAAGADGAASAESAAATVTERRPLKGWHLRATLRDENGRRYVSAFLCSARAYRREEGRATTARTWSEQQSAGRHHPAEKLKY